MSFVLDASCAYAWAFENDNFRVALPALQLVQRAYAVVPSLWRYEIASTLKKSIARHDLTSTQARGFLAELESMDIRDALVLPRPMELLDLGVRLNLTPYDAAYVQLAQEFDLPLATFDRQLIRAALQEGIELILDVPSDKMTES